MTTTAPRALDTTRQGWHRVAEDVLAAGQFAATGEIRLRPYPGGFTTSTASAAVSWPSCRR
jgi:hypothetical protein